ncbi:MAG: glycosyltransferase [Actinomycetota bacterium]|nr:glycosyltransferase [Actinomycetota bacterium]
MRPPAVAYILKMYPRFSETFVLNELLELERQGLRLHVFSLKKPDDGVFHADIARLRAKVTYLPESPLLQPGAFSGAHREVFGWNRGRYLRALGAAAKRHRTATMKQFLRAGWIAPRLRRAGITHVHAHFASGPTAVALHLHRLTGISYSFTAHAKDIYLDSVDRQELANKLDSARFAVTVSDFNRTHLSQVAESRLVRIYNGLDLERFTPNGAAPANPPLVLAVGRLIEKKGFGDLIRACALLRDEGRSFHCRIVGKGALEAELRGLIRELWLEGTVELAGALPREQLLELYPRAALLAAPCTVGSDGNRDGLPTVLIEAMALGVPVVATAVTGIPELVEDGLTGLLVSERDPAALAHAIGRILTDPGAARALAEAARERVELRFDLRANVSVLRGLLEESVR